MKVQLPEMPPPDGKMTIAWGAGSIEVDAYRPSTMREFAITTALDELQRADALAATIIALRDIVTSDVESKDEFIGRVRAVLAACPDTRVLHAVAAEREACAKLADSCFEGVNNKGLPIFGAASATAIRARGQA
jgi:hypothetical protein